jgi:hypothetical protein
MKKIKNWILGIFILVTFLSGRAKEFSYINYNWEPEPKLHVLSAKESSYRELVLKEKNTIEYVYNEKAELEQYRLFHRIIRINSAEAIEEYNRIYIPNGNILRVITQKVRMISPSGKVKVLAKEDIKEAEDEETKSKYSFFAVEGVEVGSEIEYFYIVQNTVSYSGNRERLQNAEFKKDLCFELIYPQNLQFKIKSYNGLPEMKKDTSITDRVHMALKMDTMAPLQKEDFAPYLTQVQQLIYKLNANTYSGLKDITSYGPVSQNLYKSIMAPADKAVSKKVKKLIETINLKFSRDEEDKIRTVERYIKLNFSIIEANDDKLSDLSEVLDKKICDELGVVKLVAAVLNELKIDYQVVLTCNRKELKFDPGFEAFNFLSDYLVYIPSLDKYFAPAFPFTCLGFAPYYLTSTSGLFVKGISLDGFATGVGKVKFIEPVSFDKTTDNMNVKVEFGPDIVKPAIKLEREMNGYYAQNYQPFYSYYNDKVKKEITETIMKDYIPGIEIKETTVENDGADYFGIKPFIVKSEFTSDGTVEKAGAKFIFKIGELIGPQQEIYRKEDRKLPVESDYCRSYHRVISFELPAGYKLSNPEVLNMNAVFDDNGIGFVSSYTQTGRQYKVDVLEYYKNILYPVDQFENYRKVINAAADFNKITVFLEKE